MAEIKPIRALRYTDKAGSISLNVCPPYDIISDEERAALIKGSPYNLVRLEKPEGEDKYAAASDLLETWLEKGIIARDEEECIFVYGEDFEVKGERFSLKGIICLCKLYPFSEGVVLPHENTLSKAKADRFELMKSTLCNFSSIYGLYVDEEAEITSVVKAAAARAPEQCFTDDEGVTHTLWRIDDSAETAKIIRAMASKQIFIADGHHRYETSINFRNHLRQQGKAKEGDACDFVMMMLVAMESDGLVVFPTHRIVRGVENYNEKNVLSACEKSFDIAEQKGAAAILPALKTAYEQNKTAFAFYVGADKWYMLTLKDTTELDAICSGCSDALKGLDVNVLHTLVLERAMGIDKENMAKQINLTYTRNAEEAIAAVDSGEANCSFVMNPTRVSEIRDVAAAGEKMPQKSTYFYPKLITGLVMNKFGEI